MSVKTFAAIDVGSFELTMKIFDLSGKNTMREIDCIRQRIDLGSDTYAHGKISNEKIDDLCHTLKEFAQIMESYKVTAYKAYGTSAIRETENTLILQDQIEQRTGIRVEILSNSEQRFLDYKSIASKGETFRRIIEEKTAILDIGGGSIQISLFDKDALVTTQNIRMGSLRIRERLAGIQSETEHYEEMVEELIWNEVSSFKKMYLKDRKIENIIRDEMVRAGSIELLMPMVQPAELWQETGRWEKYGPELLRIKDRHMRDFVLQPTSEEVITDVARQEIKSWRQLPVNFFHIQTKFRDERRPRFGVMRGREFTMKDAYSFDRDEAGAGLSYDKMYAAYQRIFTRIGLVFRAVRADTGSIGGSRSHEFQVIANAGEDVIAYCPDSDYAANIELADASSVLDGRKAPTAALEKRATPGKEKCELVAEYLGLPLLSCVKSVVLAADRTNEKGEPLPAKIVLVLLRADHELNEVKAGHIPELKDGFRFATDAEILAAFGSKPGYLGPVGVKSDIAVYADKTAADMSDFCCGANEEGFHYSGVNFGRDLPEPVVMDLRNVVEGDKSPDGKGVLRLQRGIEVGHVFFLGTRYSEPMHATFLDENGQPKPMQMGCYGIGVTRVAGAAIEQRHDDKGIQWPDAIAPFEVVICPMNYAKSEDVRKAADALYEDLKARGVDAILDDRDMRPGVMFAEWELIGVPHRVVIGDRGLKNGEIEYAERTNLAEKTMVPVADAAAFIVGRIKRD